MFKDCSLFSIKLVVVHLCLVLFTPAQDLWPIVTYTITGLGYSGSASHLDGV